MTRRYLCLVVFAAAELTASNKSPLMEEYNRAWIAMGQLRYEDDVLAKLQGIIEKDKSFYRAYRSLAELFVKRHEGAAGERYFRNLIERDRGSELAHYGLGEVLRLSGNLIEADKEYRTCALVNPRSWVCQDRVREGFDDQPPQVRLDYFTGLLESDPHNPVSRLEAACALGTTGQWGKAAGLLEEALRVATEEHDTELEARTLDTLAGAARMGVGQERALQVMSQELEAFGDLGDLEGRYGSRRSIADQRAVLGEYKDAIALLQKILAETEDLKHTGEQYETHAMLARTYARGGDLEEAIRHYQRAEELRVQAGLAGEMLPYIAALQARRGEYQLAIQTEREMLYRVEKANNQLGVAHSWRNLGIYYYELGEYGKSLEYAWRSIKLFQQLGNDYVANAGIGNLPGIYSALGDYSKAALYAELSLKSAREHQDASELQRNLLSVADVYFSMGHPSKALPLWNEALALSPKVRIQSWDAAMYLSRCSYYERVGNYDMALRDAEAGLAIERRVQHQPDLGYALNRVGFLNLKLGHLQEAVAFFQEALDLGERTSLREVSWEARHGLGAVEVKRGHLLEGHAQYRRSISDIEAIRGQNLAPDLKVTFLQDRLVVYQDAVDVLQRLHTNDPMHGYDREAFRIAEQSRARAFLDGLAESKAQIATGLTAEQRNRELQLKAAISQANARLMRSNTSANRTALQQAEVTLTNWTVELRNSDPRYKDLRYPDPYSAEQAQKELVANDEALIEYFVGNAHLYAWVLTKSSSAMVKLLPVARMEREVREYRRLLSKRPAGEVALTNYQELSKRLHSALLGPLLAKAGGRSRLVIVPDGILYYLPFETLLSPKGRFVVEDYTVSYAPSASVAGGLRRDARANGPERLELLAFADPAFGAASRATAAADQHPGDLVRSAIESQGWKFTPLPMTRAEVNGVAALFPTGASVVRLGRKASESNFKRENLSRYKRIHFATHAVLDEENPHRSGIVLTLPGTDGEDGILQPREIMDLDIRAGLVVLSACETALGRTVRGEGMVGLTRAFFYAGVPRVVVSQWKVNDVATAELMQSFYRRLQHGKDAAHALRDAKVEMMHSGVPAYTHPYYWAPFILAGAN